MGTHTASPMTSRPPPSRADMVPLPPLALQVMSNSFPLHVSTCFACQILHRMSWVLRHATSLYIVQICMSWHMAHVACNMSDVICCMLGVSPQRVLSIMNAVAWSTRTGVETCKPSQHTSWFPCSNSCPHIPCHVFCDGLAHCCAKVLSESFLHKMQPACCDHCLNRAVR